MTRVNFEEITGNLSIRSWVVNNCLNLNVEITKLHIFVVKTINLLCFITYGFH